MLKGKYVHYAIQDEAFITYFGRCERGTRPKNTRVYRYVPAVTCFMLLEVGSVVPAVNQFDGQCEKSQASPWAGEALNTKGRRAEGRMEPQKGPPSQKRPADAHSFVSGIWNAPLLQPPCLAIMPAAALGLGQHLAAGRLPCLVVCVQ